ncbi:MAG TPA: CopD family protein [Candidatus Binatia bacterium]|nr:CopD family protein [Candidatus Binatia bacterium]
MTAALAITGWLDLAASLALAGGLVFAALVGPPASRGERALRRALRLLGLVLPLELGLTAYRLHAVSGAGGRALLVDLLVTRWGMLWAARAAGLAALAARPRGAAALAALWLAARSFQGHAGAHGTVPALIDWLHLLAAAAWLGGLVQLALLPSVTPAVARRVRTLATGAVGLLVPAGVYGACLHVPHVHLLVESPYGRALLAKLVLAATLVGLGAANHFWHVPALERGDTGSEAALARTVRCELTLAAAVVGLSALLGVLPMPHGRP